MSARQKNIIVRLLLTLMTLQVVGPAVVDCFGDLHYQYQHYHQAGKKKLEKIVVSAAYWKTHIHRPKKNEIVIHGDYYDVKSILQKDHNTVEFIAKKDKSESVFVFIKNKIFGQEKPEKIPHKSHPPKYALLYFPPENEFYFPLYQWNYPSSFYYKNTLSANYSEGVFHPPLLLG